MDLQQTYTDHQLWIKLANHHGQRLSPNNMDCSKQNILHICNILGLTIEQFMDWSGIHRLVRDYSRLEQFQDRNPSLPLFALQGQLLEMIYEREIMAGVFNEEQ